MMNAPGSTAVASVLAATPLTERCSLVLTDARHACFGISPFNSYFSPQRIAELASWGLRTFDRVDFFVPDTPSAFTFEALGYSPAKAAWKARRQGRYTRNKIRSGLDACGQGSSQAKVLGWDELNDNDAFVRMHEHGHQLYARDDAFRAACEQASAWVLDGKLPTDQRPSPAQVECAVRYLLAELPLFIDTAAIVGAASSVFCYHQPPQFLTRLYRRELPWHPAPHQGFVTITTQPAG